MPQTDRNSNKVSRGLPIPLLFVLLLAPACGLSIIACSKPIKKAEEIREDDRHKLESELSAEISLRQDRRELDELRASVPPEKRKSNDELALFLDLMKQGREQPNVVRERFASLVEKRRASFRAKVDKLRGGYRANETDTREEFFSAQRKKRDAFLNAKRSSAEIQNFSASQERARLRFLTDERDRRQNFEAELNAYSKDFDSYMRERQNEFNEELRLYSKRISEQPKEKKAVTGDAPKHPDSGPKKALGTEEDD